MSPRVFKTGNLYFFRNLFCSFSSLLIRDEKLKAIFLRLFGLPSEFNNSERTYWITEMKM